LRSFVETFWELDNTTPLRMLPNRLNVSGRTVKQRLNLPRLDRVQGLDDKVRSDRLDCGQERNEVDESLGERGRGLSLKPVEQ
jgi:hypothetical protein